MTLTRIAGIRWRSLLALCLMALGVAVLWSTPVHAQEPAEPPLKADVLSNPPVLDDVTIVPAAVLTQSDVLLPLVFDENAFPPGKVSFVPVIINGTFDKGEQVGWTWIENGASYPLIYATSPLYIPRQIPPAATPSYLAWLGGAKNLDDRLSQKIQLPADYFVRLRFDYFTASAETECNANPSDNDDTAALYVDGVLVEPAFALCRGGVSTGWTERTIDLSDFIDELVTIEFRVTTDDNLNSNLYLDNIELCGLSGDLSLPQQCMLAGWQETTTGSATRGGVSRTTGNAASPSLAISRQGRPFLAWSDLTPGNAEIYIRRWDGLLWQEMSGQSASGGGISANSSASTEPSVATAPNGAVYVAWQDNGGGNSEIYVKGWNGTRWAEVGAFSAAGGGISANGTLSTQPSVAVDATGAPYVAWRDQRAGVGEIFIKRWNGTYWAELGAGSASGGGISNNDSESTDPVVAAGDDGTIYVAWSDEAGGDSEIYIRQYKEGQGWSDVGAGSSSGGGISNNAGASYKPALAIAPGNRPFLAWVDESNGSDTEIYARGWSDSTWLNLGSNSASGGGISNNSAPSLDPSIAVDRFSRAIVAWGDSNRGWSEINLRRWNGSIWEDIGGSSGGGGVSNTGAGTFSYAPSAAVGPDGTPYVAWSAAISNVRIYIRRYMTD